MTQAIARPLHPTLNDASATRHFLACDAIVGTVFGVAAKRLVPLTNRWLLDPNPNEGRTDFGLILVDQPLGSNYMPFALFTPWGTHTFTRPDATCQSLLVSIWHSFEVEGIQLEQVGQTGMGGRWLAVCTAGGSSLPAPKTRFRFVDPDSYEYDHAVTDWRRTAGSAYAFVDTGLTDMQASSSADRVYDELGIGQSHDQGSEMSCITDTFESRFLRYALSRTTAAARILVGGCGDGDLVTLLAKLGHQVTAFDFSTAMVEATRAKLVAHRLEANVFLSDVTSLDASRFATDFDCVFLPHLSSVVESDAAMEGAVRFFASLLAPDGLLCLSSTRYPNPRQNRIIRRKDGTAGIVTYYGRDISTEMDWLTDAGLKVILHNEVDASIIWPGVETYQNHYIMGRNAR